LRGRVARRRHGQQTDTANKQRGCDDCPALHGVSSRYRLFCC
jgi:hypothetical protein